MKVKFSSPEACKKSLILAQILILQQYQEHRVQSKAHKQILEKSRGDARQTTRKSTYLILQSLNKTIKSVFVARVSHHSRFHLEHNKQIHPPNICFIKSVYMMQSSTISYKHSLIASDAWKTNQTKTEVSTWKKSHNLNCIKHDRGTSSSFKIPIQSILHFST